MATRHLKRLQQQLDTQQESNDAQPSSDDEDSASPVVKAAPFNPFDLLSDDEDAGPATAGTSDADSDAEQEQQQQQHHKQQQAQKAPSKSSSNKKGKGRQKGAAAAGATGKQGADAEDAAAEAQAGGGSGEDIDAILKELNIVEAPVSTSNASTSKTLRPAAPPLLGIDARNLRGDSELRRIFGGDVVAIVDRSDAAEAGGNAGLGGRRRGNMPRGAAAAVRRRLKKGWLVTPKEHWPMYDGGLSMEVAGTSKDGHPVFRYVQSSAYRSTQLAFEQCQATYDPNNIAALLQRAPYHVDALLTMYDLYRHMGEAQYAEEVLDRALFALESAWPPSFDVGAGNCRVDFEVPENRALFTALFRRMQALSRQGCHVSALEVCKLLLALDPEDPLGCLCSIDYLALRAAKYDYLLRFVDEFESGSSLALLPNFAYNRALARLFQQQQQQQQASSSSSNGSSSRPGSTKEQQHGGAAANGPSSSGREHGVQGSEAVASTLPGGEELLLQAVLLHPAVVVQLMGQLQEKGVGKDAAWAALLKRKLFVQASHGGSASLEHLTSLFVERSHELWRVPDAQAWLQKAAARAADIADGQAADADAAGGLDAKDWACVRQESFAPGTDNEYRHLRLHDFSDQVNALPREEVQAAMAAGGIAGIEDELEQQLAQLQMAVAQAQQRQGGAMSEEELRNMNPVIALLRSMLPWVNAGEQPDYAAPEGAQANGAAGAGQANGDQRQQNGAAGGGV